MANTTWAIDPTHSEIGFKVKHLMISNVKGFFTNYQASIEGEDLTKSPVNVQIESSSISTNNTDRDNHLKSADFFDTENFPTITFKSQSFTKIDDDTYKLSGILTIKDVSKEIELDVEYGGTNKDPWGNEKLALEVTGKINRKDFGLNWNAALETGGVLVGDDVKLHAEVQFVKQ
ncbi:YceI family protein [Mangrovimonas sp. AS39]|uniref:YceI family protein n=1 Tax=Mangrovimonas TaxID=1211036 RepID=UPI001420423D|nr:MULTISPECIES: YceI family protein [Mangrovimonas]MCF1192245.1 YceI family protein [Mangrovimonas futianensis]MCF1196006.1 YceI family protein [Mangrovimonas futianensis]MCF1422926.1 YceI family protein [Mangrovimonas futianensis]NIK93282.1 YceI family protein [Mangrovimonas sp. CR14]